MPRVVEVDGNSMIEISRAEIENFYLSYLKEVEPSTGLLTDYEKQNRAKSFANFILTKPDNTLSNRDLIANYVRMKVLDGVLLTNRKELLV